MQLQDKIEHEYVVFKMGCLITSRENIFIHAEEISAKKYIYQYLMRELSRLGREKELIERLLPLDSILDNAYGYLQESYPGQMEEGIKEWLKECKIV